MTRRARRAVLKFVHNLGNYEWFIQTECGGTQSCDQNVTGRKVHDLKPIYLGKYRF